MKNFNGPWSGNAKSYLDSLLYTVDLQIMNLSIEKRKAKEIKNLFIDVIKKTADYIWRDIQKDGAAYAPFVDITTSNIPLDYITSQIKDLQNQINELKKEKENDKSDGR
jgi:hypothetical protein